MGLIATATKIAGRPTALSTNVFAEAVITYSPGLVLTKHLPPYLKERCPMVLPPAPRMPIGGPIRRGRRTAATRFGPLQAPQDEADDETGPRRSRRIRDGAVGGYQDMTTKARRLEGAPPAKGMSDMPVPFLPAAMLRSLARGCNLPEDALSRRRGLMQPPWLLQPLRAPARRSRRHFCSTGAWIITATRLYVVCSTTTALMCVLCLRRQCCLGGRR